jgi:dGTPase
LGAFTKYPCPALFPQRNKSKRSQKKFGFFQSEQQIFNEVTKQLGLRNENEVSAQRHTLAFLVEAADDICYSIIDLEDGCSLGLVSESEASELYQSVITKSKTKLGKLQYLKTRQEKVGYLRALAIGDLMDECCDSFLENEASILNGEFDHALTDHCFSKQALNDIIQVSVKKIYRARQVVEIEAAGHEVLPGLLQEFLLAGEHLTQRTVSKKYSNLAQLLPEDVSWSIQEAPDNAYSLARNVVDFISGLTDRHAISLYRKIKGVSF